MKILEDVFKSLILLCPASPIEAGGVLGSENDIVTSFTFDEGEYGKYIPDTEEINKTLYEWSCKGIAFAGIYHSHYPECAKLSRGDIEYINRIMNSVSGFYELLYFPIVIPQKTIISYKAEVINGEVKISGDKLILY